MPIVIFFPTVYGTLLTAATKEFLLKFAKDRKRWLHWLFEARKRFSFCVLNYIITSNYIHLLVRDRGQGEIKKSMQLVAGRPAQEYNQRKGRKGAFWEDRYHAIAVDSEKRNSKRNTHIDIYSTFYNRQRRHAFLDYLTPVDYEAKHAAN